MARAGQQGRAGQALDLHPHPFSCLVFLALLVHVASIQPLAD